MSSSARYGGRGGAAGLGVGDAAALGDGRVPRLAPVDLGPLDGDGAGEHLGGPEQRLLEEVGALRSIASARPSSNAAVPAERAALVERVLDDHA